MTTMDDIFTKMPQEEELHLNTSVAASAHKSSYICTQEELHLHTRVASSAHKSSCLCTQDHKFTPLKSIKELPAASEQFLWL